MLTASPKTASKSKSRASKQIACDQQKEPARRHGLPFSPPMVAAAFDDRVPSREPQVVDRPSMPA